MLVKGVEYNLYANKGNDSFVLEDIKAFERDVKLELKDFIGKDEIIAKINENLTADELENIIEQLNDKNKNNVSYFLISKEDDEA